MHSYMHSSKINQISCIVMHPTYTLQESNFMQINRRYYLGKDSRLYPVRGRTQGRISI